MSVGHWRDEEPDTAPSTGMQPLSLKVKVYMVYKVVCPVTLGVTEVVVAEEAPRVRPTASPTMRATAPSAKHMVAAQERERDCFTGSRPASPSPSAKHSGWHTSSTGSSGWRTVRALAARVR